jgi:hypothetical protein
MGSPSEFRDTKRGRSSPLVDREPARAILGNPEIIADYQAGVPGNGKPFPDGSKMAKIH